MRTNALRQERFRRMLNFGLLCNKLTVFKYGIPKEVVAEILDFRRSFVAMKEDPVLRDLAVNRLEVTDLLIEYARAFNQGDRPRALELQKKAESKWDEGDILANKIKKE